MSTSKQLALNFIHDFVDGKRNPASFSYRFENGHFEADIRKRDEGYSIGCGIFKDCELMKDMCGTWSESQQFSLYDEPCTRQEFFQELESVFEE